MISAQSQMARGLHKWKLNATGGGLKRRFSVTLNFSKQSTRMNCLTWYLPKHGDESPKRRVQENGEAFMTPGGFHLRFGVSTITDATPCQLHARMSVTTFPATSVSRKSRPE